MQANPGSDDAADALYRRALQLRSELRFADAAAEFEKAIALGHGPSHADLAGMLICGREGLPKNGSRAFQLADAGARLGCMHSVGALALCYTNGIGCARDRDRALMLARQSAAAGSRYGQLDVGELFRSGLSDGSTDYNEAFDKFRLAAAQGLDGAQYVYGCMFENGWGTGKDEAEALTWYRRAPASRIVLCSNSFPRCFIVTI